MRGWSDEELRILKRMYSEGATAKQIAASLADKTLNQVKSIITRYRSEYGLHYRQLNNHREERCSFNNQLASQWLRRRWDGS